MRRARSPSLSPPPPPPPKGDLQSLSDVAAVRKKAKEIEYNLERFVGSGGFNCVYLTTTNEVLRIAAYDNANIALADKMNMVRRGIQLVHFLYTRLAGILGPSTLQSNSYNFFTQAEFQRHVKQVKILEEGNESIMLCGPVQRTLVQAPPPNREFAVHHIEYLSGGDWAQGPPDENDPPLTPEEFAFSCFSLMWFFYVAEAEVGFVHGDLKGGNIMTRKYQAPMVFEFSLGKPDKATVFHFTTTVCPVVIDMDFAYIQSHPKEVRHKKIATPGFLPPERAYFEFMKYYENDMTAFEKRLDSVQYAGDWWNIGMSILELFISQQNLPFALTKIALSHRSKYASFMHDVYVNRHPQVQVNVNGFMIMANVLLLDAMLCALVNNNDDLIVPHHLFFGQETEYFLSHKAGLMAITQSAQYIQLKNAMNLHMDARLRILLCSLLSWIPEERTMEGKPFMHLYSPYFARYRFIEQTEPDAVSYGKYETLHYALESDKKCDKNAGRLDNLREKYSQEQMPRLNSMLMCGTCETLIPPELAKVCRCCSKVYCGKECRHKIQ